MPFKDIEKRRAYNREGEKRRRARKRAEREAAQLTAAAALPNILNLPAGPPIDRLSAWSQNILRVPSGHPLAGRALTLPAYGKAFLADAVTHRESLLCIARKSGKSSIVAALCLGYLVGPLAAPGQRLAIVSVNRSKAGELLMQMESIATASALPGVRFWKSPSPGRATSADCHVDVLSADRTAGHASGFDVVIVDETGLLQERDRSLLNGLRSAVSARDGRVLHLSIRGDGPFIGELLAMRDDPAVSVHLYEAPAGCQLDDEDAWHAANPGLAGGIKSMEYMRDRARMAAANPNDQADFRAHDLNQAGSATAKMLCTITDWERILLDAGEPAPARTGPVVIGFDAGGSSSMTAACAIWVDSGRVLVRGAFPSIPSLGDRGTADGVGARYERMADRGELRTYPGRTTPAAQFLGDFAAELDGAEVVAAGADRYRQSEVQDYLAEAGQEWPMVWRGQGASATADGSADVRAAQRAVLDVAVRMPLSLMMESAVAESVIRRDPLGNPSLDKARKRGRIDAMSAFVIAAGLAERWRAVQRARPTPGALRAIPFGGGGAFPWGA